MIKNSIAMIKFDSGPANDIKISSLCLFFRLFGLNTTGFAQPNPAITIKKNPNQSICFNGFRVNLPSNFAVLSPSLYAV